MKYDYIICPLCSKKTWTTYPNKYKCRSCSTKFSVNHEGITNIIVEGDLKTSVIITNALFLPLIMVFVFATNIGSNWNTNILVISLLMIFHPLFFFPREIFRKYFFDEITTIELYVALLQRKQKQYGEVNIIYLYSSLVTLLIGITLGLISLIYYLINKFG